MTRMHAILGLLFAVVVTGCQFPPKTQDSAAKPAAPERAMEQVKNAQRWERSRQCAEQAERVAKRVHEDLTGSTNPSMVGWINHYSPTFETCYLRISFVNNQIKDSTGSALTYEELIDAFEGHTVATASLRDGDNLHCHVDDGRTELFGCAEARAYMKDRMNK